MINNILRTTFVFACAAVLLSCGEGKVTISDKSYEPRIVVDGFLFPHQKVTRIRIARNFRLSANLNITNLIIDDADAKIIDESTGDEFQLTFHPSPDYFDSNYYEYNGAGLVIDYGRSYTLDVTATIEGQTLNARSTTTVPEEGFRVVGTNFGPTIPYYQQDANGNLLPIQITIERSPGTSFYVAAVEALDASIESFVYDNPFGDLDEGDVADDFDDFRFSQEWIQDTPLTPGESIVDLFWFNLWFYGEYRTIVYAADRNFKEFIQTYDFVQEDDGNFHEAKFNFEGDGIGVFGSAIADTVFFEVVP